MLTQILIVMRLHMRPQFNNIIETCDLKAYQHLIDRARVLIENQHFAEQNKCKSHFQLKVLDIVNNEFKDNIEQEVFSGFYPYDLYFSKEQLVVEINGSTHFYDTTEHRLPKYNLKDSLFKAAGINCLNIDYHRYLDENKEIKSD